MKTTHKVKSWTFLFQAIKSGKKLADIRDMRERDYKVGDILILQEYDPGKAIYTGDELQCEITHIIDHNTPCAFSSAVLDKGFGVLSVRVIDADNLIKVLEM